MVNDDDTKIINIYRPRKADAAGAAIDAKLRNNEAISSNKKFFNNLQHKAKIEKVVSIVEDFFKDRGEIYINSRPNKGKPFTVVKVSKPIFPAMSNKKIDEQYRNPLKDLEVEIVFSKSTNSYLYRIY